MVDPVFMFLLGILSQCSRQTHDLSASDDQRLGMNPISLPHLKGNGDSFTGNSLII